MELEIHVDRNRCIGSGQCVHWAPGAFTQDDDAISVVIDPRGEPEEKIVRALTSCPVQAISLRVDGVDVAAAQITDWHAGPRVGDPLASMLESLSDDHHELRTVLGSLQGSGEVGRAGQVEHLLDLLARHYGREEGQAYPAISDLVGDQLAAAFDADHAALGQALDEVMRSDGRSRASIEEMAARLEDHIRLEETVLFPVALKALSQERSAQGATPR